MAVVEIPAIEIGQPEDLSSLDRALDSAAEYDWIAFTSGNAVDSFLDRAQERGIPVAGPSIAAVGPVTAERLSQRGVSVHACPAEATATALAREMIVMGADSGRILIPVGDRSRPDLADALRAAGARVETVIAYRTLVAEAERERLRAIFTGRLVDALALASPSALDAIAAALDGDLRPLRAVRLVCIGPTTARAVHMAGLIPAAVAEPHTAAGLAAAVAGQFTE
jgi:uroporphyrinogen-III synthase